MVEMNMGQLLQQVKLAVNNPERVFLVNRLDGMLVTPTDIGKVMRIIEGRGF
jgi:2-oxoglutarate ferredoxin oxidoreductase subunit alpha